MLFSISYMAMFYWAMLFAAMVAISLVSLVAILDLPFDPSLLYGWWNRWRVVGVACEVSPSLGCSLAFRGTDSSLLEFMIVFYIIQIQLILTFSRDIMVFQKMVLLGDSFWKNIFFSPEARNQTKVHRMGFSHRIVMVKVRNFLQTTPIHWPRFS